MIGCESMTNEEIAEYLFQQLKTNTSTSLTEVLNEFSKGEVGVLSYLAFDKNSASSGELSEKLNVTTARIARILNSLESKKLIKRKEDKLDKRKIIVEITKEGVILARVTKREIINKIIGVVEEVGYEEIKEYVRIALKIREVLKKY